MLFLFIDEEHTNAHFTNQTQSQWHRHHSQWTVVPVVTVWSGGCHGYTVDSTDSLPLLYIYLEILMNFNETF